MKKTIITILVLILTSFSVLGIVGHPAAQVFPGLFATGNYTFATNVLHIDDTNDRVGIGIISPLYKLHIYQAGGSEHLKIESGSSYAGLVLQNVDGASSTGKGTIMMSKLANYEGIRFLINDVDEMIIDESGNVGIGTTDPSHALNVIGDLNVTGDIYANSSSIYIGDVELSNNAGTLEWGGEEVGGAATTYTYYGSNSCAGSDTELYDGKISTFKVRGGSSTICVEDTALIDDGIFTAYYSWGDGLTALASLGCSVCEASSATCFDNYGSNSCPTGYTEKYDGYITSFDLLENGGSTICVEDTALIDAGIFTAYYSWGDQLSNIATLNCSVCCKS